jgi:hypothetical protein
MPARLGIAAIGRAPRAALRRAAAAQCRACLGLLGPIVLCRQDSTVLARSRTLRAGFAGTARFAGGILDCRCARRSADRQSGRRDGQFRSNKGMRAGGSCGGGLRRLVVGVEQGLPLEQGASHRQQAVGGACPGEGRGCAGRGHGCGRVRAARRSGSGWPRRAGWRRGPNDRARSPAACCRRSGAPRCRSCRCAGSPAPPRTAGARRGNLAGAEAARPPRAAWRGRSFRRPARIAGSSRRAARSAAPARSPRRPVPARSPRAGRAGRRAGRACGARR